MPDEDLCPSIGRCSEIKRLDEEATAVVERNKFLCPSGGRCSEIGSAAQAVRHPRRFYALRAGVVLKCFPVFAPVDLR
ncbi:hypothetical protein AB0J25_30095 [Streptomyces sp. NPDC049910]|uniref:hypothetical protein n=1 Tax=Streptomyces sp. NPDC049910 TaxID=3155278 RepID=UPI003422E3B8